jgi:hypothetical protein
MYSKKFMSSVAVKIIGVLAIAGPFFSHSAQAVTPPPDGCYPNGNTAEGCSALFSLSTGQGNTALGANALYAVTTGGGNTATGWNALRFSTASENTATGAQALYNNTTGTENTAIGSKALLSNTQGSSNTAVGFRALQLNTESWNTAVGDQALANNEIGYINSAVGDGALFMNVSGYFNTAMGARALYSNTVGVYNTGVGNQALYSNTSGNSNTATGLNALAGNTTGNSNTATGFGALAFNSAGSNNIAIGYNAGSQITATSYNVDVANSGDVNDVGVIRIGTNGIQAKTFIAGIYAAVATNGVPVYISSAGQLGTTASSARFKEKIRDMADASDVLLSLRPVAFRYKPDIDPEALPQFGLVAEEVEKVDPNLVVRDGDGKPYTVRYDAVNAMLLNEFLKEHCKVEQLEWALAKQQEQIEALKAGLQKVRIERELSNDEPQLAGNSR